MADSPNQKPDNVVDPLSEVTRKERRNRLGGDNEIFTYAPQPFQRAYESPPQELSSEIDKHIAEFKTRMKVYRKLMEWRFRSHERFVWFTYFFRNHLWEAGLPAALALYGAHLLTGGSAEWLREIAAKVIE